MISHQSCRNVSMNVFCNKVLIAVASGQKKWRTIIVTIILLSLFMLFYFEIYKNLKVMDEDKMKALLDEYLSKSNANMQEILDEKLNKMEDILKREINELRTTVQDIEKRQEVINTNFDTHNSKIQDLINDNKKLHLENKRLNQEIDETITRQEETEVKINQLAQYNRSSFMLEISGIPLKKSEDAVKLIEDVAIKVKIKNFDREQIDVAHGTSKKNTAPIIILFKTKNDRNKFYKQKKNIFSVSAEQFVESNTNNEENSPDTEPTKQVADDDEISMPGLRDVSQKIGKRTYYLLMKVLHTQTEYYQEKQGRLANN